MEGKNQSELARPGHTWPRWALAAVLVLAIAAFYTSDAAKYFSWAYIHTHLDILHEQAQQNLLAGLAVYFVLYVAITALSIPVAAIVSLLAGWLFGRWLGTALVSTAATLGATLAFLSSRFLFRAFLHRRFAGRLQALDCGIERDGPYYLFTLRLVPVFPFFLVNLGMGLTRMSVRTYIWVSWAGMLPGTFLYVNAGEALKNIESAGDVLSPEVLIALMLLGIVPLVLRKLIGRGK